MLNRHLRDSMEWALMVVLVLGAGALAQAQQNESEPEGRIVQIGPSDGQTTATETEQTTTLDQTSGETPPAAPAYWIGLLGGPVTSELRAHLDIPENQGVLVRNVVPNSPATAAGLEQFDVLLAANGNPLHDMRDLVGLVGTAGESQSPIELEVLHRGQVVTISVTPTERPEELSHLGQGMGPGHSMGLGMPDQVIEEELLRRFGHHFNFPEGGAMEFRSFGPGAVAGGQSSASAQIPGGVSVSVQRADGQPPQVTVKRGEESWTVQGDDPESLSQIPDDVRPFVEQMLHGQGQLGLPGGAPTIQSAELRERIETMERQMEELQQRLLNSTDEQSAEKNDD